MSYLTNPDGRKAIAESLDVYLANTTVLYFKTHSYHWNVEGRHFYDRHVIFEEQYNALWSSLDEIAERMRALGAKAPLSLAHILCRATQKEAEGIPSDMVMVEEIRDANMLLTKSAQDVADIAEKYGDRVTADMMTQHSERLEKNAWMLNSIASSGPAV